MKIFSLQQADTVLKEIAFAPPQAVKKLNQADRNFCLKLFRTATQTVTFPNETDLETQAIALREKLFSVVEEKDPKHFLVRWIISLGKGILNVLHLRTSSHHLRKERQSYLHSFGVKSESWVSTGKGSSSLLGKNSRSEAQVTVLTDPKGDFQKLWEQYSTQNDNILVIDSIANQDLGTAVAKALDSAPNRHIFILDPTRQTFLGRLNKLTIRNILPLRI